MWKTSSRCGRVERDGVPQDVLRDRSPRRQSKSGERNTSGQLSFTSSVPGVSPEKGLTLKTPRDARELPKLNKSNGAFSLSLGAKLLKALRRKVISSSGNSGSRGVSTNNSQVHDDRLNQDDRRDSVSQEDDIYLGSRDYEPLSVEQLQEELHKLRKILDSDRAEMLKLRKEVSWLRLAGASGGFSPVSEHYAQAPPPLDGSSFVSRTESVRSDVSCLDFSLASTGMLKFEGETKTKISPTSDSQPESGGQLDSFLPGVTAASTSLGWRTLEDPQRVNNSVEMKNDTSVSSSLTHNETQEQLKGWLESTRGDIPKSSITAASTSLGQRKMEYPERISKLEGSSNTSLSSRPVSQNETRGHLEGWLESARGDMPTSHQQNIEPEFVKHCHNQTGADLKLIETFKKPAELQITPPNFTDEPEQFGCPSSEGQSARYSSRSPPKSVSSTDESEPVISPSKKFDSDTDSEKSLVLHKADLLKMIGSQSIEAMPDSARCLSDSETIQKLSSPERRGYESEKSLRVGVCDPIHECESDPVENDKTSDEGSSKLKERDADCFALTSEVYDRHRVSRSESRKPRINASGEGAELAQSHSGLSSLMPEDRSEGTHNISSGSSPEVGSKTTREISWKASKLSRSKSQGMSSTNEAPKPFQTASKSYAIEEGETSNRPATLCSRRTSIDGAIPAASPSKEMLYPELELDKLSKTLKSVGHERSLSSSYAPQPTCWSVHQFARTPSAFTERPRRSLDSQVKALSYSEPSRAVVGGRYDHHQNHSRSGGDSSSGLSYYSDNPRYLDRRNYSGSGSSNHNVAENWDSPLAASRQGYPLRSSLALSPSHSPPRSPSRYGSECQLHEVVSGAVLKSGSGVSIAEMLSCKRSSVRSVEKQHLEEGVRRYGESPRQLPTSDASSRNSDEVGYSAAKSPRRQGEEPFSVLALSRRRRSMEKEKTFSREHEYAQYGQGRSAVSKDDKSTPRSRTVLHGVEVGGKSSISRRRSDDGTGAAVGKLAGLFEAESRPGDVDNAQTKAANDRSTIRSRRLREAMELWDKEKTADSHHSDQSVWDQLSVQSRSRRSRSRFYLEATSPVYSGFGSRASDFYSTS